MYITPTVTSWSNGSPVRPSKSDRLAVGRRAAALERVVDLVLARAVEHRRRDVDARAVASGEALTSSLSRALVDELPMHLGLVVEDLLQAVLAELVAPKFFSSICRWRSPTPCARPSRGGSRGSGRCSCGDGTPSGLSTMSTGVPSSRYGMSSSAGCGRRRPCCRGGRPSCRRPPACA